QMIAALPAEASATPAQAAAAPGAAAPGAASSAGSGTAAPGAVAPGAVAPAGAGAKPPSSTSPDPRWVAFAAQLRTVRAGLVQLEQARGSAQAALTNIELLARRGNELPREIAHDLTEQRAGLGAAYAELATDAAKAGDKNRARRLLTAAAHLDPGNRARYEKQLQSFDPSGRLSSDTPDSTGSAGQGAPR
ncbi:MAG TPA: hypothetical protein VF469_12360, partial [Kofleriaceae bacterium]